MSPCRTCGKLITLLSAKNLFQQADNHLLKQIEVLTGLFLLDLAEFPAHICQLCETAISGAIEFRESIIRTQQLLLKKESVSDVIDQISLERVEKLYLKENEDKATNDFVENDPLEHLNMQNRKFIFKKIPMQDAEPVLDTITVKPNAQTTPNTPTLVPSLNFGPKAKQVPRNYCKKLSKDELGKHKRERRKRECICEQCGKHFSCPSNFRVHLLTHTGVKNYTCKLCPLKFYTPHLLRVHELGHSRPYSCRFCEKTYTDLSGRIQHERNHHTNFKPYKCPNCDKSFAGSSGLKSHMVTHSGIRNFHCKICDLSFKTRKHLSNHYLCKGHKQNAQSAQDIDVKIEDPSIENT